MKFNNAYSQMFSGYPDAVSLQQAAEMLGLNRHTVGELIRSRRLFALKIGRTYRIPKLSVIEFLLTGKHLGIGIVKFHRHSFCISSLRSKVCATGGYILCSKAAVRWQCKESWQ